MNEQQKMRLLVKVSRAFRPGAPIDKYELFAGRREQVKDIISAISQPGRHVIMYGERGVGKTSLARVLSDLLSGSDIETLNPATINCDGTDNFSSLWHKILREISFSITTSKMGFQKEAAQHTISLENLLPSAENIVPDDIRYILQHYQKRTIIVIDEVDRLSDRETTTLLADTIKNLSDHSIDSTLILVGVADSVTELIAEHKSIERALMQVHVPRMSLDELLQILDKGFKQASMRIDPDAKIYIAHLSQGLPYYTHSLGLHSAEIALENDRIKVAMKDVSQAIEITVRKSESIFAEYHRATDSPQKGNLNAKVLLACALAPKDDRGYFSASDVRAPMSQIMGKAYDIPSFSRHLYDFCEDERGPILQKVGGPRRFRFRFINPLMQPFVIIHALSKGLLEVEILLQQDQRITKSESNQ